MYMSSCSQHLEVRLADLAVLVVVHTRGTAISFRDYVSQLLEKIEADIIRFVSLSTSS